MKNNKVTTKNNKVTTKNNCLRFFILCFCSCFLGLCNDKAEMEYCYI